MTEFNLTTLGMPTEFSYATLDPEAGIAYAKATNDPTPLHLDGSFIPPIYGVVPVWEKVFEVVTSVVPEEHFFSVVHGEQDMIFHHPLKAGITLRSMATGISVSVKESGTALVVKSDSFNDENNELVLEQYFTMFFRGVDGGQSLGEPHSIGLDLENYKDLISSGAGSPSFVGSVDNHMDDDQTFRYAQASGDFMPIHIDDEFAKSVGLGGIIIHGLCTMAGASWAAISQLCDNDPTRLARIATRFSKPLRPGDDLRTSFFKGQEEENAAADTFCFVSQRVSDGEIILTNSLVDVLK
jgi:acyl dehydratase